MIKRIIVAMTIAHVRFTRMVTDVTPFYDEFAVIRPVQNVESDLYRTFRTEVDELSVGLIINSSPFLSVRQATHQKKYAKGPPILTALPLCKADLS